MYVENPRKVMILEYDETYVLTYFISTNISNKNQIHRLVSETQLRVDMIIANCQSTSETYNNCKLATKNL